MKIKSGKIPNTNMKFLTINKSCGNEVVVSIRINLGSRDETNNYSGLAHCLEHMFFKGTSKYPSDKDINNEIYKCGGYFNATTYYDKTIFYIYGTNKCLERIVEILSDLFYNSLFRPEDLEKEKKVIINELNTTLSNINSNIYLLSNSLVFKNTRLEKPVIGNIETINKINIDDLKNFINTYYKKDVIITICGNINNNYSGKLIKKYFNKTCNYPVTKIPNIISDKKRIFYKNHIFKQTKFRLKYIKRPEPQQNVILTFPCYNWSHENIYIVQYITELLSGYSGSILELALRHNKGLIYSCYSTYEAYEDLGMFNIYFSTDNDIILCLKIILHELFKLKSTINITDFMDSQSYFVESFKNSNDNISWLYSNYSDELYYTKNITLLEKYIQKYKQISVDDIYKIAKEMFVLNKCSICYSSKNNINKKIYKLIKTLQYKKIKTNRK